jgi:hypothetical protein
MSDSRFFVLRDEHGIDHEANLEPIQEIGLSIPNPLALSLGMEMTAKHVISQHAELTDDLAARVIPGTRIVETNDFIVAEALLACQQYDEFDGEPTKAAIDKARKEINAHVEAMARRDDQVAKGELEPPDAADHDVNPDNLPQAGEEA